MPLVKNRTLALGLTLLGGLVCVGLARAAPGDPARSSTLARFDPPSGVVISGPGTGWANTPYAFTATVSPLTPTLPITYFWQATNQLPLTHTNLLSDVVTFTWLLAGSPMVTVTAVNPDASVTATQTLAVYDRLYLPVILRRYREVVIPPPGAGWRAYVNYYRALAGLQDVAEDPALTDGAQKHTHYMILNNVVTPYEYSFYPGYTAAGARAAVNSNLFGSSAANTPDEQALAIWMQGPFHALGILDPELQRTGFGSDRASTGYIRMAAALDIISGLEADQFPGGTFPVMWPGDSTIVSLRSYTYGTDAPEPLASCPGYTTTTGLPLILQIGDGSLPTVDVTATTLGQGGVLQAHCWFTENTYTHPDASSGGLQDIGRAILGARDAVVLIPRDALTPGGVYTVSITANGQVYAWSFKVAND